MKKIGKRIAFLVAILLCGFMGFGTALDWLPPLNRAEMAAMQLDVNLTKPDGEQPAVATESAIKTQETEPEEKPSSSDIEVEIVRRSQEEGKPLRVLIYHTHTYEAYEPAYPSEYKQTERWRTADPNYNIVRVGAELARVLREQYGMIVVHDDTAFEPPSIADAYQRSLEAIENYTARGETFDLYLDIHRDAYIEGLMDSNTVEADGEQVAHIMLLVGKGSGTFQGHEFAQKPDWEENYARAEYIAEALNARADGLSRVKAKDSRYNQHVSTGALLIEVGNNMNSLAEAMRAVPYIARAIADTAGGTRH